MKNKVERYMNTEKNELSALMLANVEALAGWESSGESSIKGDCTSSYVIVTDCNVRCESCNTTWYTSPRIKKANATNISGSCSCGRAMN